jgi:hypothetical protein
MGGMDSESRFAGLNDSRRRATAVCGTGVRSERSDAIHDRGESPEYSLEVLVGQLCWIELEVILY